MERVLALVVVTVCVLACKKGPPPQTFDVDAGGPFIEARAIQAIQKEPVLAIHNTGKRDRLPLIHWDYDFRRWGWGSATLTHRSHGSPDIWMFELGNPIERPCDGAFLSEQLLPVTGSGATPTWTLQGGPLAGALLRQARPQGCNLQIASRKWAEENGWALP